MKTSPHRLLTACFGLLAAIALPAQTLTHVLVGKTEFYRQTHAVPVNINADVANPTNSAEFSVTVRGTGLSAPTVTLASGSTYASANPTEHNGGVLVFNSDGEWGYGLSNGFGIAAPAPQQNTVNNVHTLFSNGSYTVNVPTIGSVSLTLGGAVANPALPGFMFSQGAWVGGKFVFDPTQALTITTTGYPQYFTGGAGIGGHMDLWVDSASGFGGFEEEHFSRVAPIGVSTDETLGLTNNFLSHTFAANTFTAGQDYEAGASFARIIAQDTSLAGVFAVSYFERENSFTLSAASAVPEPSTYAALAGAGALGVALLRRRRQAQAALT